ncbi:hypothetical protein LOAG_17298 [Loa loa]|uniref:Uncharacterized protein n=1 Tax=Loa loa TaxID=7209 RepID=A0A1S0UJ29_LOALO|nr:hypothetical protein LOAG_17298 [Loa loa]EJD75585.1 hypothetical protein LOAG_17298 [Loa loa]
MDVSMLTYMHIGTKADVYNYVNTYKLAETFICTPTHRHTHTQTHTYTYKSTNTHTQTRTHARNHSFHKNDTELVDEEVVG